MRILLIAPSKLNAEGQVMKYRKGFIPPLAPAILSGLTPRTHSVRVLNDVVEEIPFSKDVDLVGISAMTPQAERAYQIADRYRAMNVRVVLGGVHVTSQPEEAARHADAIVQGEAEEIWQDVLADCAGGKLKEVYKNDSWPDLKRLVVPRFDGYDLGIYAKPRGRRLPMIPIFTTRGCPFACEFCFVTQYHGQSFRTKPIANVLAELDEVRAERYFFVDDNIVGDIDYSREMLEAISPRKLQWMSQASTTILKHPDLIELAARAGCDTLFFGIESINRDSLRSAHKAFNNPDAYRELFARLRKVGIMPYASLIIGFDEESAEQARQTVDFLMRCKVGYASFFILTPYPGTGLRARFQQEGRLLEAPWSLFDGTHVVFKHKAIPAEQLLDLYWKTFASFYSYPNIARRAFANALDARKPLTRLLKDLLAMRFYRANILQREHPFSGGLGRAPSG